MSEHPMQAGATEQSPKEFLCVLCVCVGGGGGGGARPPWPLPWIRHWVTSGPNGKHKSGWPMVVIMSICY